MLPKETRSMDMKILTLFLVLWLHGQEIRAETENQTQDIRDMFQDMKLEVVKSIKSDFKQMMQTNEDNNQLNEDKIGEILEKLEEISMIQNEKICNTEFKLHAVNFTTTVGEAGATSSYSGHTPNDAFNGKYYWHSGEPTMPQAVWFHFDQPIKVIMFSFESRNKGNSGNFKEDGPSKYEFFGSNGIDCSDQSSWNVLRRDESGVPFSKDNNHRSDYVKDPNFYTCYGFKINEVPGRSSGNKWVVIKNVIFRH